MFCTLFCHAKPSLKNSAVQGIRYHFKNRWYWHATCVFLGEKDIQYVKKASQANSHHSCLVSYIICLNPVSMMSDDKGLSHRTTKVLDNQQQHHLTQRISDSGKMNLTPIKSTIAIVPSQQFPSEHCKQSHMAPFAQQTVLGL